MCQVSCAIAACFTDFVVLLMNSQFSQIRSFGNETKKAENHARKYSRFLWEDCQNFLLSPSKYTILTIRLDTICFVSDLSAVTRL